MSLFLRPYRTIKQSPWALDGRRFGLVASLAPVGISPHPWPKLPRGVHSKIWRHKIHGIFTLHRVVRIHKCARQISEWKSNFSTKEHKLNKFYWKTKSLVPNWRGSEVNTDGMSSSSLVVLWRPARPTQQMAIRDKESWGGKNPIRERTAEQPVLWCNCCSSLSVYRSFVGAQKWWQNLYLFILIYAHEGFYLFCSYECRPFNVCSEQSNNCFQVKKSLSKKGMVCPSYSRWKPIENIRSKMNQPLSKT